MSNGVPLDIKRRHVETTLSMGIAERPSDRDLQGLGFAVDFATDLRDSMLLTNLARIIENAYSACRLPHNLATLSYFVSNCWAGLHALLPRDDTHAFRWDHPEATTQLLWLRRSIGHSGESDSGTDLECRILVNTGNTLTFLGRSVEAIDLYDAAMRRHRHFAMAIGAKGLALNDIAAMHHDQGQSLVLAWHAYHLLSDASKMPSDPGVSEYYSKQCASMRDQFGSDWVATNPRVRPYRPHSKSEIKYRKWSLDNGLFLNPMNSIGSIDIANRDTVLLPSLVLGIGEHPGLLELFNEIKQEYVSARTFLWEHHYHKGLNFCDRHVSLVDTLQYASYGHGKQKLRLAFRMSFSILDKIALFVKKYFGVPLNDSDVTFRTVWYKGKPSQKKIASAFSGIRNQALRALYQLSGEIGDRSGATAHALSPVAIELLDIRNHLEHRALKLVHDGYSGTVPEENRGNFLKTVLIEDFENKTLFLLKAVRAAIHYLAWAVRCEEARRSGGRREEVVVPRLTTTIPDDWKR